ncbi:putative spermidine/putrescine transport system ATP-binding protein [Leucobacter exalbidus]|uniref:Spermidine/putrescine import ATP-binding protein PotA n=1 Tax=Leucobacter exalbidus TaxID=662960 RepID=A0A940PR38_9MICO|nr:ABC transporter ATP-binding protein [Leucobacter exalbidus]MBP1326029.1 putative spermidine/putrescine transport system ATP-binding protein [Leucobacter exalbidus]
MTDDTILEITGLSKHYGEAVALEEVTLSIQRGEFLTFLGPSGSGKTTTLNLIAGFIEPSSGRMLLNDKPIDKLKAHERNLGVVFQHYALFPHMSVAENIAYPLKQRKIARDERDEMVSKALEMVRLSDYAERQPKQLSGGQQQRVALARAVVYRPPILLMDEPLGALDKKLREWLQLELRRIHRELGSTFVYVTHDQEEALVLSDRIAVFNEGRIEQVGTAHELYSEPKTLFVGKFIGESSVFSGRNSGGIVTAQGLAFAGRGSAPDGPVCVLVRPEKLVVADADGVGFGPEIANQIPGVVEDVVYLGSAVKYNVSTPVGEAVVRLAEDDRVAAGIGDKVTVGWATQDGIVLEDSGR